MLSLVSVLSACSQVGALGLGRWVHEYIGCNGLDVNSTVATSLVNFVLELL